MTTVLSRSLTRLLVIANVIPLQPWLSIGLNKF